MAQKACRGALFWAAGMALATLLAAPTACAGEVTGADLRAVANALGFLDGLPHGGPIDIGIVYAPDNGDAKIRAAQAATLLSGMPGPNQSPLRAQLLTVKDLTETGYHVNAVLLMPSAVGQAAAISDAARRRKVLTVSTDPSCLASGCCALMVRADGRVQIVLDTAVADAVGARFSSVFKMMVERR